MVDTEKLLQCNKDFKNHGMEGCWKWKDKSREGHREQYGRAYEKIYSTRGHLHQVPGSLSDQRKIQ